MSDSVCEGVTDDFGRVFDGAGRAEHHDGLYVADGSLIPTSLGANPLFTIAALSERVAAGILEDDRYRDFLM